MKTWQGSLGVSELQGIVSPAYIVCRTSSDFHRRYLHLVLRSRPYVNRYKQLSFGVRVNQWDMRYEDFKQIPVFFPPLTEQAAIARFLDLQDRRIRQLIHAKGRLIELLNEQKQAIIHGAVTRGLTPHVCLRPSGIDWLGAIPVHWEIMIAY
jgi:type I restriction enzyme, S subunit